MSLNEIDKWIDEWTGNIKQIISEIEEKFWETVKTNVIQHKRSY